VLSNAFEQNSVFDFSAKKKLMNQKTVGLLLKHGPLP
jgi:hypothetical protein